MPFFTRAIEIDPNFAMAHANLGLAYSAIGESVLVSRRAREEPVNCGIAPADREKFFIDFDYDREVTGNLEKRVRPLNSGRRPILATCSLIPVSWEASLRTGLRQIRDGSRSSQEAIAARSGRSLSHMSILPPS